MEITPQVLTDADNFHIEQQNLIRRLQVMPCYGLLPESAFNADINIEGDTLIIKNLVVRAITPQGEIIDINEPSKKQVIQNVSQAYIVLPNFQIVENLFNNALFVPIAKINNNYLDYNYIPPCVSINSNQKLLEIYTEICNITGNIVMQIKEQERYKTISLPLSLLMLELKNYSTFESPAELFLLVKKIIMLFEETLTENLLDQTYCHTDIYIIFSIALNSLRELEEKTKEEPKIKRIPIAVKT